MRPAALAAALAGLVSTARAHINGFEAPATIQAGHLFNVTIDSSNWIQSSVDVSVVFGYTPGTTANGGCGTVMTPYLLTNDSNTVRNYQKQVMMPSSAPKGPAVIVGCFTSLFGVGNFPTVNTWNVSVTIGDHTSMNYVSSSA